MIFLRGFFGKGIEMRINNGYVVKEIAGKYVIIPAGQNVVDYKNMLHINDTAAFVLDCMKENTDKETILNKMIDKYEAQTDEDRAILKNDLDEFIAAAIEYGAVTED